MPDLGNPNNIQLVIAIGTIIAALTSVFAIGVGAFSLRRQRLHDSKSVQPIPQIVLGDYEDELFVKIENAGLGPAIIASIIVEDKVSGATANSVIKLMPDLGPQYTWDTFVDLIEGRAIPAQSSLVILKFSTKSVESENYDIDLEEIHRAIRQTLGRLSMTIRVTDIYGKKTPEKHRDFDWFTRRLQYAKKAKRIRME